MGYGVCASVMCFRFFFQRRGKLGNGFPGIPPFLDAYLQRRHLDIAFQEKRPIQSALFYRTLTTSRAKMGNYQNSLPVKHRLIEQQENCEKFM